MQIERKFLLLPRAGVVPTLGPKSHLYFLAGPIKGGEDWHTEAIELLLQQDPDCFIACPREYGEDHSLRKFCVPSEYVSPGAFKKMTKQFPGFQLSFSNNTSWERFYMGLASYYGAIIFWLPDESKEFPRESGAYARDTRGEIARWSVKSAHPEVFSMRPGAKRVNIVVGGDPQFDGMGVIRKNLDGDHRHVFPVSMTLKGTITDAVKKAHALDPVEF